MNVKNNCILQSYVVYTTYPWKMFSYSDKCKESKLRNFVKENELIYHHCYLIIRYTDHEQFRNRPHSPHVYLLVLLLESS